LIHQRLQGTLTNDLTPLMASAGADINHLVRASNRFFVVLHHEQGVAARLQGGEHVEKDPIVARVQTNGRFVQDVADALQGGAQLGGQANSLGLATRKGRSRSIEAQVAQADVAQETKPGLNLRQQITRDGRLAACE
jgi:hypothetical protein